MAKFSRAFNAASATPNPAKIVRGRVLRYKNEHEALVRGPRGTQLVASPLPLAVSHGGRYQAVDLRLRSTTAGFSPRLPHKQISIARHLAGGVAIGADGLTVTPEGGNVTGRSVNDKEVFFANVAADTDAVVAPTAEGAELFASLRSRDSPEVLRYRLGLSAGMTLRRRHGQVEAIRGGRVIARIPAPTARDAQGQSVSVTTTLSGHQLVLRIEHKSRDFAYPILVDPWVDESEEAPGWSFRQGYWDYSECEGYGCPVFHEQSGAYEPGPPGWIVAPTGHNYEEPHEQVAQWIYENPTPMERVEWWANEWLPVEHELEYIYTNFDGRVYSQCAGEWIIGGMWENTLEPKEPNEECEHPPAFPSTRQLVLEFDPKGGATGAQETTTLWLYGVFIGASTEERRKPEPEEEYGSNNPGSDKPYACAGKPVNCATGNETDAQTDIAVDGKGPTLHLVRTYNSKLAEAEGTPGPFGYGWTGSYSARVFRASTGEVTVYQDNGSTVTFEEATRGQLTPTQPWIHATLKTVSGQYVYTLPNQTKLTFTSGGYLEQETDRNGNTTTIAYEESEEEGGGVSRADFRSRTFSAFDVEEPPRIATVTDASGRQLTFSYTEDGLVNAVSDPEGHTVKYEYEEGNLVKTTLAGETGHHNEYGYDELHRMTSIADGRKETTEIAYDEEGRVISEVDPTDGELKLEYTLTEGGSLSTTITEPSGAVKQEKFNSDGLLVLAIHGFGTADAVTETFVYDGDRELTGVTDGNGHTTKYTFDSAGNRISQTDPDGDKSEWEYDEKRDVISTTTPNGEQTTIERDADGNALKISRPAPGGTQTTEYTYNGDGELTSMTDPLERVWKYEYDANGNRIAEIDPEGNKRTFGYNANSQEISTTSPRGNVPGADPTRYTTIIERDAQGRVSRVIEPLE